MSVYNHRPMIPTAQNRISELLDTIKVEFDSLNQEASVFKMQRDDLEHKMTNQIQEMSSFQQNLYDLERTQQSMKNKHVFILYLSRGHEEDKKYEEEIMRLRQQLEQARAGHPPTPGSSSSAPSGAGHPSQAHQQPIPPNLGHGPSNLFGNIINNGQGGPQGPPGLVAPPQMVDPSQQPNQHSGYPTGPSGPPPQPPNAAGGPGGPPGTPYMNGGNGGGSAPPSSGSQQQGSQGAPHPSKRMRTDVDGPGAQPPAQGQPGGPQGMYGGAPSGGGIPTPPAPGGQNNAGQPGPMMGQPGQPGQPGMGDWNGYGGYPSRGVAPGTPTSQPANLPVDASGQSSSSGSSGSNKRKSGAGGPGGPPAGTSPAPSGGLPSGAGRSSSIGKQQGGQPGTAGAVVPAGAGGVQSGLSDMDPETVPASLKIEGSDWFAIFNPKVPRQLKVDLIHTLDHPSVVCCVKFSADGKYLAAGCNRSTHIYETSTANRICVLQDENIGKEGDLYIRYVCFSPDGKFLATGAEDKQIRIWDIQKKRIRQFFTGHEQDIYSLDFSRDGRIIASGSGDRTARIWDMETSKCLHILRISDQDPKDPGVTSVAISPDGRLVAAGSLDKMVRIWDTNTGYLMERLEGHKDSVYAVAFMPDGKTLVSGSLDKTLKLWQLGTSEGRGGPIERDRTKGPCKMTFQGHKDFVLSVGCTPCGNWVVSGSKDRGVQFWDPRTGQTQFMLQGHKNSVISVALSPTGRTLFATGSGDNRARIWSYETIGPQ